MLTNSLLSVLVKTKKHAKKQDDRANRAASGSAASPTAATDKPIALKTEQKARKEGEEMSKNDVSTASAAEGKATPAAALRPTSPSH